MPRLLLAPTVMAFATLLASGSSSQEIVYDDSAPLIVGEQVVDVGVQPQETIVHVEPSPDSEVTIVADDAPVPSAQPSADDAPKSKESAEATQKQPGSADRNEIQPEHRGPRFALRNRRRYDISPVDLAARETAFRELADQVSELERRSRLLRRVAKLVRPSVVHIEAGKTCNRTSDSQDLPLHDNPVVEEAGAGVIVRFDKKLYVLTNRHVVRDCLVQNIRLTLADGRVTYPVGIKSDPSTDVAIIEIDAPGALPARTGNSDSVDVGDYVLAFGSPFGLSHSMTHGIISAKGRRDLSLGTDDVRIQDFIQTDAAINPGNSGGPLFNVRGEVVGINTAIASDSGVNAGIGFAIPVNIAKFVGAQLVVHGRVRPTSLGVRLDANFDFRDAIAAGLPKNAGAKILRINSDSNAELAGLQPGDIVFRYDGVLVEDDSHLVKLVGLTPLNKKVKVLVYRDGEPLTSLVHMRPAQTKMEISRRSSAQTQ